MDRENIIRMAREAGWDLEWGGTTIEQVQNFAALVAAAERHRACLIVKEYLIIKDYCDGDVQNAIDDIMNDDVVVLKGVSDV